MNTMGYSTVETKPNLVIEYKVNGSRNVMLCDGVNIHNGTVTVIKGNKSVRVFNLKDLIIVRPVNKK